MVHELNIAKADSALVVELSLRELTQRVLLLLDFERIPTRKRYQFAAIAGENTTTTTWSSDGGTYTKCILTLL